MLARWQGLGSGPSVSSLAPEQPVQPTTAQTPAQAEQPPAKNEPAASTTRTRVRVIGHASLEKLFGTLRVCQEAESGHKQHKWFEL